MGRIRRRRLEEIRRASKAIFETEFEPIEAPQINGKLRGFALRVPEQIQRCSGIVVFGSFGCVFPDLHTCNILHDFFILFSGFHFIIW